MSTEQQVPYSRFKEELDKRKALEEKLQNLEPQGDVDLSGVEDKITLRKEGLTEDEIKLVISYAKGAGVSVEDALGDPNIKNSIQARMDSEALSASTPKPSDYHGNDFPEVEGPKSFQDWKKSKR